MLFFYLFLSIGVSFLCSLFEAVILSTSSAYANSLANAGSKSGKLLKELKENIDDSLSSILTLNTIAHTIGAAGVGAEVLKLYGDSYVAIASVILTLLILVLSEIIPKTIGALHYRKLAIFAVYGIKFFIIITYPFVLVFKLLAKLLRSSGHVSSITRDEIAHTAEIGFQEGNLNEDEVTIIKNLLRLKKIKVSEVMTPRTVVYALKEDSSVEEVVGSNEDMPYSRIPVYRDDLDHITGMVLKYNLLKAQADGNGNLLIKDLIEPLHSVPESASVASIFNVFMKRKDHLFSVYDEHGGFDGLISLEDVIETLLGIEITDEFDSVEDLREYAAKQWEKRKEDLK